MASGTTIKQIFSPDKLYTGIFTGSPDVK